MAFLPREPLAAGKGRGNLAEYTAELTPEESGMPDLVGVFRVRPLSRRGVPWAPHKAGFVKNR